MNKVEIDSPAKVNLLLKILGKRPDGFHELITVIQAIDLNDTLQMEKEGSGIKLTCSDPGIPLGEENLVVRAARLFFKEAKINSGVRIHLEKRIPVAAGLGGGSSDAAHTLIALNDLFNHPLQKKIIGTLASSLGSDVPFFLEKGAAVCRGRGEIVQHFDHNADVCLILVNPAMPLSTKDVYRSVPVFPSSGLTLKTDRHKMIIEALQDNNLQGLSNYLENDLEPIALQKCPVLSEIKNVLSKCGFQRSLVSGSGPTVFALAPKDGESFENFKKAQNLLPDKFSLFFVGVANS